MQYFFTEKIAQNILVLQIFKELRFFAPYNFKKFEHLKEAKFNKLLNEPKSPPKILTGSNRAVRWRVSNNYLKSGTLSHDLSHFGF